MVDIARARSWARESVDKTYHDVSERAALQYLRNIHNLGAANLEDVRARLQELHHLTHPETARVFGHLKAHLVPPNRSFESYRTQREQEYEEDGHKLNYLFTEWAGKKIGVPLYSWERQVNVEMIAEFFHINATAATALLADLVDEFENEFDVPALLPGL